MRAFMVKLPSVVRYWTVVDDASVTRTLTCGTCVSAGTPQSWLRGPTWGPLLSSFAGVICWISTSRPAWHTSGCS